MRLQWLRLTCGAWAPPLGSGWGSGAGPRRLHFNKTQEAWRRVVSERALNDPATATPGPRGAWRACPPSALPPPPSAAVRLWPSTQRLHPPPCPSGSLLSPPQVSVAAPAGSKSALGASRCPRHPPTAAPAAPPAAPAVRPTQFCFSHAVPTTWRLLWEEPQLSLRECGTTTAHGLLELSMGPGPEEASISQFS